MRIKPNERDEIATILREEIEEANRRISVRLSHFECRSSATDDSRCDLRRFYEDLTDKAWTDADEECLRGLDQVEDAEIRRTICEAFRRSPVHPVPSLSYLINLLKRNDTELHAGLPLSFNNPDAISAVERERMANVLNDELSEATSEIVKRLRLGEAEADMVRELLDVAGGNIIARFTPLV
jgi:hypothetical protein